jgi:homoserine O-acetyltransferase/O-succinyltransferase
MNNIVIRMAGVLAFTLTSVWALAADYPAPTEGDWVARDFRFHTGEVMPELRLHYRTVGNPSGDPVLILHGTGGSGASMLTPAFAGELFGSGQPLDASKYLVILPDAIGTGKSSKPSDGLRTKFPKYNYDDMVEAQYRLVTEGLGIRRLRLVLGNSMGGMQTWLWGERYPDFMDALVPMASQPTPMASRNWMLRRMMIEMIRNDPEWNNGNYTSQPRSLLAINSADDERNPPETGITERELKRVKNGRLYLVPASEDTRGHGTTGMARFWKRELQQLLETAPRRTM